METIVESITRTPFGARLLLLFFRNSRLPGFEFTSVNTLGESLGPRCQARGGTSTLFLFQGTSGRAAPDPYSQFNLPVNADQLYANTANNYAFDLNQPGIDELYMYNEDVSRLRIQSCEHGFH